MRPITISVPLRLRASYELIRSLQIGQCAGGATHCISPFSSRYGFTGLPPLAIQGPKHALQTACPQTSRLKHPGYPLSDTFQLAAHFCEARLARFFGFLFALCYPVGRVGLEDRRGRHLVEVWFFIKLVWLFID